LRRNRFIVAYIITLICGAIVLLFALDLYFRNNVFSRVPGIIFNLMCGDALLATLSDFLNDKATVGYLFGVALFVAGIAMAEMMIVGFWKEK
jgi:hypothetical protein